MSSLRNPYRDCGYTYHGRGVYPVGIQSGVKERSDVIIIRYNIEPRQIVTISSGSDITVSYRGVSRCFYAEKMVYVGSKDLWITTFSMSGMEMLAVPTPCDSYAAGCPHEVGFMIDLYNMNELDIRIENRGESTGNFIMRINGMHGG